MTLHEKGGDRHNITSIINISVYQAFNATICMINNALVYIIQYNDVINDIRFVVNLTRI